MARGFTDNGRHSRDVVMIYLDRYGSWPQTNRPVSLGLSLWSLSKNGRRLCIGSTA